MSCVVTMLYNRGENSNYWNIQVCTDKLRVVLDLRVTSISEFDDIGEYSLIRNILTYYIKTVLFSLFQDLLNYGLFGYLDIY